jgi:hypothetical protein
MSNVFTRLFSGIGNRVDETTKNRLQDELTNLYEEQNKQVKNLNEISKKIDEVKGKINNLAKDESETKTVESQSPPTPPPPPPVVEDETVKKDETQPPQEGENNFLGFSFKNPFAEKESEEQPTEELVKPVAEPDKVEPPAQLAPLAVQPPAVQPPAVQPPAVQPPAGLQSPPPNANGFAAPQAGDDIGNFNTGFGDSDVGGGKKHKNKKQRKTKSNTQSGGKKRRTRRHNQKAAASNAFSVTVENI